MTKVSKLHVSKAMDEEKQAKAALAWVRKQAKAIDPSIVDDSAVCWCTRIIAGELNGKNRHQGSTRWGLEENEFICPNPDLVKTYK